jgi:DtxR family transcriptional regulator, iron-dependent repressor
MEQMQLSEATQEYLESIYWLYEAGIDRTQANLARALQVSQPSASEMLRRLSDDGLVSRDEHKLIQFTDRGREVAARIVARHRTRWSTPSRRGSRPRCSR